MSAEVSDRWNRITREVFQNINDDFLAGFRRPGRPSYRFVGWDPREHSSRFFKFLLFTTALKQSPAFFQAYARIQNRDIGDPLTIRCRGCDIDADYLAAVEEWEFLTHTRALDRVRTVVEIGAGFGRTCHTLLTLCPAIQAYYIVDLPPMLALSQAYLARAIPGAPVTFVSSDDLAPLDALTSDLVINIDSFQEMPPAAITRYMTRVVRRAPRFYCNNPIGKYLPAIVGLPDSPEAREALTLGYCRDVIDIFNDEALEAARETFVTAYCPPEYRVVASRPMDLFPFYLHVLYTR